MKRGLSDVLIIFLVIIIMGIAFMIFLFPRLFALAENPVHGCPRDVPLTTLCPCGNTRISSGYCCENGPSLVPCYCANINKCSQYSKTQCAVDECKLNCNGVCA